MARTALKKFVASSLVALLVLFGAPAIAHAETSAELQAQLDEANAKLSSMNEQVASLGEQLNDTMYQLDQTQQQIDSTQSEITTKQAEYDAAVNTLSKRVSSDYKSGPVSFLSTLLSSTSFDDFVSNVYYADKVSEQDAATIDEVKSLKTQLESQKADLENQQQSLQDLADQQQQQKADLDTQVQQAQAYSDSLSQEVKDKIAEEQAAAIAAQQAAAAQAQAEAAAAAQQSSSSSGSSSGSSSNTSSGSATNTGEFTGSTRDVIIAAAYSQLGVKYVWAACSPGVAFDCSGFTMWCYAQAGISIPHSAAGQYSCSTIKPQSEWQPGDLVFWIGGVNSGSGNHVAIYLGNNQIIHANGTLVTVSSIGSTPTGGGSPF